MSYLCLLAFLTTVVAQQPTRGGGDACNADDSTSLLALRSAKVAGNASQTRFGCECLPDSVCTPEEDGTDKSWCYVSQNSQCTHKQLGSLSGKYWSYEACTKTASCQCLPHATANCDNNYCYVSYTGRSSTSCNDATQSSLNTAWFWSEQACSKKNCACRPGEQCRPDGRLNRYCYQSEPTCSDSSTSSDPSKGYFTYEACGSQDVCQAGQPNYMAVHGAPQTRTYSRGVYAQFALASGGHSQGTVDLQLDVYQPRSSLPNLIQGRLRPIAIVMPGSGASKNYDYYPEIFKNLASYGFVTMGVNYRNYYDQVIWAGADWFAKDPLEDLKAVVQWAKRHAGEFQANPQKIVLVGTSAGAITIANFVTNGWGQQYQMEPGTVQAAVLVSGRLEPPGWNAYLPVRSDGQTPSSYWTYFTGDPLVPASQTEDAINFFRPISAGKVMNVEKWEGTNHVGYWIRSQNADSDNMVKWLQTQLGC